MPSCTDEGGDCNDDVTLVASWANDEPFVAIKRLEPAPTAGRVVAVNTLIDDGTWSGDVSKVVLNAIEWLLGNSRDPAWLDAICAFVPDAPDPIPPETLAVLVAAAQAEDPACPLISGGGSWLLTLNFDGAGFTPSDLAAAGELRAKVSIEHNVAGQDRINIPVAAQVGIPNPVLTSLSQNEARENDPAFTLIVLGENFVDGAVVLWGNQALPTTFVDKSRLEAQVGAANLSTPGPLNVSARNPDPGGASNALVFTVLEGDGAPSVVSTAPSAGATNVAVNTTIQLQFGEPVEVTGDWFQISCVTSGTRTVGDTAVGGGPTSWSINPNTDFVTGETCTVTVFAANVIDQDTDDPPNNMAKDHVWSFTTASSVSTEESIYLPAIAR